MRFTMQQPPKGVLSRGEIRKRLIEEFQIVSDLAPKPGRPINSLIGTERCLLDILVGVRIFNALEAEAIAAGLVMDPSLEMYLTPDGKRRYVSDLLSQMSSFRPREIPDRPIESLYKSYGPLLKMLKTTPVKRKTGGRFHYINKNAPTNIELCIVLNTHQQRFKTRQKADAKIVDIHALALDVYPAGKTFHEAYAEEANNYLRRR